MSRKKSILLLSLCFALVITLRLAVPIDIDNKEQYLQGLYLLDMLQKGAFFLPTAGGQLASKPPLYTWTALAISLLWGEATESIIKLPSIVAGLGVVYLTFLLGEMLFSGEVGLLAGLILTLNFLFSDLSCTARTDMVQCFFISLSLYCFLRLYRDRNSKLIWHLLFFVSGGLGCLTKGPVAFLLPLFIVVLFLFFRKDLPWLKTMRWGVGITISLAIVLAWFIPTLVIGGQGYYDIVIRHGMVDYYLGIGRKSRPLRPYFLIPHFFMKYLPWSLFVPSSIGHYWKSKTRSEQSGFLFLIVWVLTMFVFFSMSRGKRPDYLLPLYPAASLMGAQFWDSLVRRQEDGFWTDQVRLLSATLLSLSACLPVSLTLYLARPEIARPFVHLFPESSNTLELIHLAIARNIPLFLCVGVLLAGASVYGVILALRRNLKGLLVILLLASFFYLSLYFGFITEDAGTLSGEKKKEFCLRARKRIITPESLQFCNVEGSILFYMKKNNRPLKQKEVLDFFQNTQAPYLITNERTYRQLKNQADFEFVILEESEFIRSSEKTKYLLIGKKDIDSGSAIRR